MPLKNCRRPSNLFTHLLGVAFVGLSASLSVAQQEQDQNLKPEEMAQVRFWNMRPRTSPNLSLVARRGENIDPVLQELRGWDYTSYVTLAPKKHTFSVQETGAGKKTIGEVHIDAEKQRYYTIIAESYGKNTTLRVVEDTYTYDPDALNQLTVHQFIPGLTATVSVNGQPVQKVSQGQTAVFRDLPKNAQLRIQAITPQGSPFDGVLPVSFDYCNRSSCLIMLDRYAEMTARVQVDGYLYVSPEELTTPTPAPTPSPTP